MHLCAFQTHLAVLWCFAIGGGFALMCQDYVIVNILGCFGNMLLHVDGTAAQCCRKLDMLKVILARGDILARSPKRIQSKNSIFVSIENFFSFVCLYI